MISHNSPPHTPFGSQPPYSHGSPKQSSEGSPRQSTRRNMAGVPRGPWFAPGAIAILGPSHDIPKHPESSYPNFILITKNHLNIM
jgi:hypothetical protein